MLPLLLWTIIIFHEIIPHYHPNGNNGEITLLFNNDNNRSESKSKSDENGILDNIIVIVSKHQVYLNPIISFNSIYPVLDFTFFYIPDLIKTIKYFKSKAPPIKLYGCSSLLFRGPPLI